MTALDMDVRELTVGEIDGVSGGGRGAVLRALLREIRRKWELGVQQLEELMDRDEE